MFIMDAVPDDAPPVVREGIARRRMINLRGVCPCGAIFDAVPRGPGGVLNASCEHAADCPAADKVLRPAWQAWQAGRS